MAFPAVSPRRVVFIVGLSVCGRTRLVIFPECANLSFQEIRMKWRNQTLWVLLRQVAKTASGIRDNVGLFAKKKLGAMTSGGGNCRTVRSSQFCGPFEADPANSRWTCPARWKRTLVTL